MSGYGHSGPHAEYRSYGPVVQAVSGLSYISGLPGREPSGWGLSYMDNQAAFYNSAALLMALYRRNLTGAGTEIDVSAIEAGINLVGPVLLDVSVNGRSAVRPDYPTGNRLEWPNAAPHGVYPARGDDRWVAIAVFDDAQWAGLVRGARRSGLGRRRAVVHAGRAPRQPGSPRRARRGVDTPARPARGRRAAAGRRACRPGRCRTPRISTRPTRRSPIAACSSRWTIR